MISVRWRFRCISCIFEHIGHVRSYSTDECWITSGGTEIVEVMRGMDRKAMIPGEEPLPHHLETFDWVAMYFEVPQQYPCHVSKTCYERIIGTSIHVQRNKIRVEVFVRQTRIQ